MLIYIAGSRNSEPGRTRRHVILLGKYSLFGYIAQIAILQLLHRGIQHIGLGTAALLGLSFLAAFALTMISVEAVDRVRTKSIAVDGLYKAVFS